MTQLEAMKEIAKRGGGVITPAAVIRAARNPKHVLHGAFTWDDTEAAKKWRVLEAQRLIRRFTIETVADNGETVTHPVFIGVSSDRDGASENNPYRLAEDVAKNEDLLAIAEKDALDQLKAIESRFRHLTRLGKIWAAIDEIQDD